VRFGVLGPLLVLDGDAPLPIPAAQHRRLLAALLARAGQVVSFDELAEQLWDGSPPPGARATLRDYVKRLRHELGPRAGGRLVTRTPGYLIEVGAGELDLDRFTLLLRRGREAAREQRWAHARADLAAALEIWRGEPFADETLRSLEQTEVPRLNELRLEALEWRIEADLMLGRHDELIGELRRLIDRHPLRERLTEQLMLALYRSGRQSDALTAYQGIRSILRNELGVEPGPALAELQRRILAADPDLLGGTSTPEVSGPRPAQLPLDVRGFAGREVELAELDATEGPAVVSGTAGVGKTALAVHWAHRVADRYPDGQLYLNLRGFDPVESRTTPGAALRAMLEALGVAPPAIPEGLAAQAGLYRSTLHGRRVLIVLDNARDEEQVRPLLPGSPGCMVVVTSRSQLRGLVATEGAHPLVLDLLDVDGARRLLTQRIGADRIAAEPEAVREIVDRCARLPLALAVVAARAVANPHFPLSALAGELAREGAELDAFGGDDPASNLRAVFSWSYQSVGRESARVFRLLGLHPGPHLATPAVASLAGVPIGAVRPALAELSHANLLREARPGRYTMHDLLRAYATELVETGDDDDRRAALHRLLDHYLHTAHRAALLLGPHRDPLRLDEARPGVTAESLVDRDGAWAWFTVEYPVLLGILGRAAGAGFDKHVWQLAWACSEFLERLGKWHDHIAAHDAAYAAATRAGDQVGQAHASRGLGLGNARLARYEQAHAHFERALALSRSLGDHNGQARAHNNAGWVLQVQKRYPEAIAHTREALELYRASGFQAGQATALNNIGWYYACDGNYPEAIAHCEQALVLHMAAGHSLGMAETYDSIGYAHHRLGEHRIAVTYYLRALDLFRQSGAQYQEAATATLTNLGDAYRAAGDEQSARRVWRQALTTLQELGQAEADAATGLRGRIGD
jgi:DNA-binding SARP family transcriptional activator/tetratricopeptide (TPR) repeat protein